MKLLATKTLTTRTGDRRIELLRGDLTAIPTEHAVDALLVSAFYGDYLPVPRTLIGGLFDRGVSVDTLYLNREIDLRQSASSWLSRPINRPDLNVGRILCFEHHPSASETPDKTVGDLFRALVPLTESIAGLRSIATPILASGSQGFDPRVMLQSIVEAAARWMHTGLALDVLKIVVRDGSDPAQEDRLIDVFTRLGGSVHAETTSAHRKVYDLFISYAREDADSAEMLHARLASLAPDLRVFIDRHDIGQGASWQREIFEALDQTREVVCLLSPEYLASGICLDEFHVGWLRQRARSGTLRPVLLRSADLPTYMQLIQHVDARERDHRKLLELTEEIAQKDRPGPGVAASAEPDKSNRSGPELASRSFSLDTLDELISTLTALRDATSSDTLDVTIELSARVQVRSRNSAEKGETSPT